MQNTWELSVKRINRKTLFRSKSPFLTGFLFILPFLFLILFSCQKKESKPGSTSKIKMVNPVAVEIKVIQPELLLNVVTSTGSILANERAEIRPEISGRIVKILFEEGTIIQKNKLLVKLNDSDLQAQLKRNRAQGLLLANDEKQKQKLLEIKAISQDEYDAAYSLLQVNQADKELLESQIAKTEIYAPFTGKIGLRSLSVGNYVATNTLIATIQQIDPIKIEFDVPEKYSNFIQPGLQISFQTDASDSIYKARVYALESAISMETRTLKVRALCANANGHLNPGSYARINMILESIPDAIKVPSEAVLTVLNGNSVFICKNGKAVSVPVKTGIRTESEIQIKQGISAGDTLILTGLLQLSNGSPLILKSKNAKTQSELAK